MKEIFGIFGRKKEVAKEVPEQLPEEERESPRVEQKGKKLSALGEIAVKRLEEIIKRMGFAPQIKAQEEGEELFLEMHGDDLGRLIGREGATLNALQNILSAILAKQKTDRVYVKLDANNYRLHREQALRRMARDAAQMALHQQKPVELEPMSAGERRIIHTELSGNKDVHTYSKGDRQDRRIIVAPGAAPQEEPVAEEQEQGV